MKLRSNLTLILALSLVTAQTLCGTEPDPLLPFAFDLHFSGLNEAAIQQNSGYYRPVPQQPYQRKCGTIATDVCETPVTIPPNATGEQLYQMAKQADASGRKGEGLSYLKASAERGNAMAEGVLGSALLTGNGAMKNTADGVAMLEKSAAQGNRGAQVQLGMAFEDGELVRADQAKAVYYLKMAAEQHHSIAEHRLGLDYELGRGVPRDRALAIQWLKRAAADGAPVAGQTAAILAKAGTPRFTSIDELDAYMAPPAPKVKAGACPTLMVNTVSTKAQATLYLFCQCHPGCPYFQAGVQNFCAQHTPYCQN